MTRPGVGDFARPTGDIWLDTLARVRFKPELTQRELADFYMPSDEELRFARKNGRSAPARLYIIL